MYIHNVPAVFYNYNPLINYINSLIDYGYKDTSLLAANYKSEIIALLMDALGDDQSYVIFDNDDFPNHCNNIKSFFRTLNIYDAYAFANGIKQTAFNKYKGYIDLIMESLISQRRAA